MPAHPRPLAGRVIAEAIFAKRIVLRTRNGGGGRTGPHRRNAGGEPFTEHVEGTALRRSSAAHDQRAANLREISLDGGPALRLHQTPASDAALRGGRHTQ